MPDKIGENFMLQNIPSSVKPCHSSDTVFIHGLKVDAIIGVFEWEKNISQPLIYDIEMIGCQRQSAITDNIEDAINYKTVCERVAQISKSHQVSLLEKMAQLVADMILTEFRPEKVIITIHKPTAITNAQSVGVKICRSKTA